MAAEAKTTTPSTIMDKWRNASVDEIMLMIVVLEVEGSSQCVTVKN